MEGRRVPVKPIANVNASAENCAWSLYGFCPGFSWIQYSWFTGSQCLGILQESHSEKWMRAASSELGGEVLKPPSGEPETWAHTLLHRLLLLPRQGAELIGICCCRRCWFGDGHARGPWDTAVWVWDSRGRPQLAVFAGPFSWADDQGLCPRNLLLQATP